METEPRLEIRRIADLAQAAQIYESRMAKDFALNELRPWPSLQRSWERGEYLCFGLYAQRELLGYAFFIRSSADDCQPCLLDYFAVADRCRGQGLGSLFLSQLGSCLPHTAGILIEVEDPDTAEDEAQHQDRERRLRFYLRNGCRPTGLQSRVFGADYVLLELPSKCSYPPELLREIYSAIYRRALPPYFYRTNFQLR